MSQRCVSQLVPINEQASQHYKHFVIESYGCLLFQYLISIFCTMEQIKMNLEYNRMRNFKTRWKNSPYEYTLRKKYSMHIRICLNNEVSQTLNFPQNIGKHFIYSVAKDMLKIDLESLNEG
ncbi:unnamed protein product (macronuclear) [Paramecium tetraurelia]|uniref:Uncharacterized protein n=1 Tax=Paramecium tetraurelia TaxID=5888 RepID=A0DIH7_PARTE|nr:uncharacterized protein GSPATT00039508001 [Paramecium tetraurelia]CAK82844.1 unnamed protein product [Paramecium tetraurelia]|eukprot:XP_001450241.1 hypothetical protein (macronuclear) [Paramecium tetraurelia strain d4-2]